MPATTRREVDGVYGPKTVAAVERDAVTEQQLSRGRRRLGEPCGPGDEVPLLGEVRGAAGRSR